MFGRGALADTAEAADRVSSEDDGPERAPVGAVAASVLVVSDPSRFGGSAVGDAMLRAVA